MQSAADRAQSITSQMQGARAGKNTLINGAFYLLVYGAAQVTSELNAAGGEARRTLLTATATRDQFSAAPTPKTKLTRTDLSPTITYLIDHLDMNDPLVYTLVLEKVGKIGN